ncbi:MAG: HIT domain-containing protein [Thermodesulfovibrionales bacterium]|nr:HIT domain-containing protein [Thermodesulfovibrionales bacterium]
MKNLWAPWRMEYILSPKEKECIFCTKVLEKKDRQNLILYRGNNTYVIMNKYPYNNAHLMVVPYTHVSELVVLSDDIASELFLLAKYSMICLKKAFNPEGFNVGINIGAAAGAGIEEHLHLHIVPRWAGDTNFMIVTGEIKSIPEHILDTYDKLYPIFNMFK